MPLLLFQKLRYNVQAGYAEEERKMCHVQHKNFSRNIAELCFFNMEIPQLIPSSLNTLDPMIDVSYIFRVSSVKLKRILYFVYDNMNYNELNRSKWCDHPTIL